MTWATSIFRIFYFNEQKKIPPFYKYLKRQYADELVRFGRVRIGTVFEYSNIEDKERRDETEGTNIGITKLGHDIVTNIRTQEDLPSAWRHIFQVPEGGTNINFIGGGTAAVNLNFEDAFIYCVTDYPDKNIIKEFGCDACVEIFDIVEFGNTIARKLVNKGLAYPKLDFNACMYHGKESDFDAKDVYYLKPEEYAHQKEHRVVIYQKNSFGEISPQIIACRELTSVCRIIEL